VKLSELLDESAVLLGVSGQDKWQVIEGLTDQLVATGGVPAEHRDEVHAALVAREKSMSTGMEQGIAIPHTSVPHVARPVAALGIAPEGVDFQAIDGRPTHLVILLVNPAHRTKDHVRTLAEIARLLSSGDLRESLVRCEREGQVVEIIRAAEAPVA
jgi:mannitol/fructose-specific phosphotransferase system IIA component (Ntr-type)